MNVAGKMSAVLLGGLLSLPAWHANAATPCNAGDLAGAWSFYSDYYVFNSAPSTIFCNVTFQMVDNQPIKYNMSGTCKLHTTASAAPLDLNIAAGGGTLVEVASTCKLTGTFAMGTPSTGPMLVTILDARIDGGSPKERITGIARIDGGSNTFQLLKFRFRR